MPSDASEASLLRDEGIEWSTETTSSVLPAQGPNHRTLRIAVFTENWLPVIDGVTRTVARLLQHLRLCRHEAILFGPNDGGLEAYCGHPIVATRGIPLMGIYPSLKLNFFRPLFIRRLLEFGPDVILFVDPIWLSAAAIPACMTFLPNVPRVASYHTNLPNYASLFGFGFLEPTMWRLIRHLHDRVDVSFCPSASTKAVLESKGFENVRIWSRGVDTSSFSPAAASSAQREAFRAKGLDAPTDVAKSSAPEVVAVYVGRLSFEKNLRLLVDAMRSLRFPTATNPACRVVFVGDGPARNAIESLCRQYGISATFMGHLRGQALAACFASADLFAFPSFSETFGQVVLEAMASGLPVVGLRSEGVKDLVMDGVNGLLLDFDDLLPKASVPTPAAVFTPASPTFATAVARYRKLLLDLAKDPQRRVEMGQASRRHAVTYSWSHAMTAVTDTFQELRADRRASLASAGLLSASSSRHTSPRLNAVRSHELSRVPTFDESVTDDLGPVHSVGWASAFARNASSIMLGRRYGRASGRQALGQWLGGTHPSAGDPAGSDQLDHEELMSDQVSEFYKSSGLAPRLLIVIIVVWQLAFWTLKAAVGDVRTAVA